MSMHYPAAFRTTLLTRPTSLKLAGLAVPDVTGDTCRERLLGREGGFTARVVATRLLLTGNLARNQ
jgi:hypothetical protein